MPNENEIEQSEKIFEVIKMLMEFGEKDLAFELRVAHDTHLWPWRRC